MGGGASSRRTSSRWGTGSLTIASGDFPVRGSEPTFTVARNGGTNMPILCSLSTTQWIASEGQSKDPWIILSPSANLERSPGTVSVTGLDGSKELMKLDVGALEFQKVDLKSKETLQWWDGDWASSQWDHYGETTICWTMHRTVSCTAIGLEVSATFAGVADASKYTDMVERNGKWSDAGGWKEQHGKTLQLSSKVSLGDKKGMTVTHNLGAKLEQKDREDPVLEVKEIGASGSCASGWSSDTYTVNAEASSLDPIHSLIVGFVLARYMHPHRADEAGTRQPQC